MKRDALTDWQNRTDAKLARLLKFVSTHCERYRSYAPVVSMMEARAALKHFPVTDKYERQETGVCLSMLSDEARTRLRAAAQPFAFEGGFLIAESTTGSSGNPVFCYKSAQERMQLALSAWKHRRAVDRRVSQQTFFCLLHAHPSQPRIVDNLRDLRPENLDRVLDHLVCARPLLIHGSPTDLDAYATRLRQRGDRADWNLAFIESNSELLTAEQRANISDAFGTQVINNYGTREAWSIAYECRSGHLHVTDEAIVEILDAQGNAFDAGKDTDTGEVAVTALSSSHYPFIRYRLGDLARLRHTGCTCGNDAPILELSEARKINLVHRIGGTEGATSGLSLFKNVIQALAINGTSSISKYKVIQDAVDHFSVYLVTPEQLPDHFYQEFQRLANHSLGGNNVFDFQIVSPDHSVFSSKAYSFICKISEVDKNAALS